MEVISHRVANGVASSHVVSEIRSALVFVQEAKNDFKQYKKGNIVSFDANLDNIMWRPDFAKPSKSKKQVKALIDANQYTED